MGPELLAMGMMRKAWNYSYVLVDNPESEPRVVANPGTGVAVRGSRGMQSLW